MQIKSKQGLVLTSLISTLNIFDNINLINIFD